MNLFPGKFLSNCSFVLWKVPKDYTAKLLSQRIENDLKIRKTYLLVFCRMAALKLERLKENGYVEVPFYKRYPVTLLNQGSTGDIFLAIFRLFSAKLFQKNTCEQLI